MKNLPKLYNIPLEEINEVLILKIIKSVTDNKELVITPLSVLGVTGFPIANQTEVLGNKPKIKKIKNILINLKNQGIIQQRKSKQDYKGIKETAYDLIKPSNRSKTSEKKENHNRQID
ncbi:hypothetical protein M3P19_04695 [Muricauda sp. 2012CJ35-5]|uniref:Uncharacterized protein n=1 Tax=Flagellimonas spongiicola TaxID=2942208 RepID=A0ABT0PPK5_9FLAO|nr:hypothetical protein [Allomuricauda spongiicola]MCL6273294.1 hypothetical protein [Allomuricauda spongiicola]